MTKFERETATHEADLPHQFVLQEEAMVAKLCQICAMTPRDARHVAWEQQEMADRERAGVEFRREMGS
jgi:hypothetical protein